MPIPPENDETSESTGNTGEFRSDDDTGFSVHPPSSDVGSGQQSADPADPANLGGSTLGDFHLLRVLGSGGMANVYLAEQISLKRKVALKVLRPDLLADDTYLERFAREATAAAGLNHNNISESSSTARAHRKPRSPSTSFARSPWP